MASAQTASSMAVQVDVNSPTSVSDGSLRAWIKRFDAIYRESEGRCASIPWAHSQPCPSLLAWLNAEAPSLVRPGARTAVVGCWLGQDAVVLSERGYDVTAFDICSSAVDHARSLHPQYQDIFCQADVLDMPGRLTGRFDLVVEVHTLQALPPEFRVPLANGMASLLSHHGILVAVARGRDPELDLGSLAGPPWEFTPGELTETLSEAGLSAVRSIDDFLDDNDPPVRRLRGIFARSGS